MIFPKWTNYLPLILVLGLGGGLVLTILAFTYWGTDKHFNVGYQPVQPIKYSHQLHVTQLGLDCRYCHSNVETSANAGVPPTELCFNCHKFVLPNSPEILKLKAYHDSGKPVPWVRIHKLPEHSYFNHSVHVAKGVGCVDCHGRVDQMDEVRHEKPLSMGWCLECHKNPMPYLRPKDKVTKMDWTPAQDGLDPATLGKQLMKNHQVNTRLDCSTCHR